MISTLDPPSLARAATCAVTAQGRVWLTWEALNDLRRQPPSLPGGHLTAALLKHADEQTIATMAALSVALADSPVGAGGFSEWGVVSAPRYLGRSAVVSALQRFRAEGAWGVSPHLIPHRTLHSVSGTISQALKAHGPNFGVGGSPETVAEPLLAALALLHSGRVPGVWLTLSRQEPEAELGPEGQLQPGTGCAALVLALTPLLESGAGLRLEVAGGPMPERKPTTRGPLGFDQFRQLLDRATAEPGLQTHELPEGGTIQVAAGRSATPCCEAGRSATPCCEAGRSATPCCGAGRSATPFCGRGREGR